MELQDFLFGTAAVTVMSVMDNRRHHQLQGHAPVDDEAQFDDGFSDDYVGDGLDGSDAYDDPD